MFGSVEQAFDLGAAGVGATIYFGSRRVAPARSTRSARRSSEAHELGMFTVLWCYLRNNGFKVDGVDYHACGRPHRPGQPPRRHHRGRHHQAEAAGEQRRLQRLSGFGKTSPLVYERAHHRPPDRPHPLAGRQLLHGQHRAHQLRRRVEGRQRPGRRRAHRGDQQAGRRHRASSAGARRSSGPTAEGVELLNAIQDVYLDDSDHHRLIAADGAPAARRPPASLRSPDRARS